MDIKPGSTIKIVTEIDQALEKIRVKNSVVYEISGTGAIILAQTDPPVVKSMLDRNVIVTYLIKQKKEVLRFGFPGKIVQFLDTYKLSGGREVKAIEVLKKGESAPYSLRMFYRVAPTERNGFHMTLYRNKINILDISVRGVSFSYDKTLGLEINHVVEMYLDLGGTVYTIEAMILRTWETEDERYRSQLGFASAEFLNVGTKLENILSRKIREIERENRFREIFP